MRRQLKSMMGFYQSPERLLHSLHCEILSSPNLKTIQIHNRFFAVFMLVIEIITGWNSVISQHDDQKSTMDFS